MVKVSQTLLYKMTCAELKRKKFYFLMVSLVRWYAYRIAGSLHVFVYLTNGRADYSTTIWTQWSLAHIFRYLRLIRCQSGHFLPRVSKCPNHLVMSSGPSHCNARSNSWRLIRWAHYGSFSPDIKLNTR